MTPDPHLLPDGSTSWGPDPENGEEAVANAIYAALEDSYSIARETTEAPTKAELQEAARAAFAAAPPEWWASTEQAIAAFKRGVQFGRYTNAPVPVDSEITDKLSRALRGGEDRCPRCGKTSDEKCAEDGPGLKVNTSMCPRKRVRGGEET